MPPTYTNGHISATGDPIHFMFGSRVGFSGTADRTAIFPVRTNPRLEKFQMAISPQPVVRSTSCFVVGGVFGDGGFNGAISGSNKSKIGKISNGHISATGRPIHFMFGYRVGFSGKADLMALFSIRTNSRWWPPPAWLISNGHISATAHDIARIARSSLR